MSARLSPPSRWRSVMPSSWGCARQATSRRRRGPHRRATSHQRDRSPMPPRPARSSSTPPLASPPSRRWRRRRKEPGRQGAGRRGQPARLLAGHAAHADPCDTYPCGSACGAPSDGPSQREGRTGTLGRMRSGATASPRISAMPSSPSCRLASPSTTFPASSVAVRQVPCWPWLHAMDFSPPWGTEGYEIAGSVASDVS